MGQIRVFHMYQKVPAGFTAVDTTSKSGQWAGLSPFLLGPAQLYQDARWPAGLHAANFENLWQFAKVYHGHLDPKGDPTPDYWTWAKNGWADTTPRRYPMGKGAAPAYSLWDGKKLGYIDARKTIYGPIYAALVQQTQSYTDLVALAATTDIVLRDYDGYDHDTKGLSLSDVLNNPAKKMGHAFVLKALLTQDPMLGLFTP